MNDNSKRSLLKEALLLSAVILAAVKLFWVGVEFYFLPATGVEPAPSDTSRALPTGYRLASNEILRQPKPRKKTVVHKASADPIKSMTLLGIYRDGEKNIAVIGKNNKNHVLLEGEHILGYRVEQIGNSQVTLSKNGKEYILEIRRGHKSHPGRNVSSTKGRSQNRATHPPAPPIRTLPREEVNEYTKDLDKIWKNIEISPHRKEKKIDGFEVRFVKRKSLFSKMGLRRGDIITAVNGESIAEMESPTELIDSIETLEGLTLEVQRGKEKVELEYEIR